MSTNGQSSRTVHRTAQKLDFRLETINPDKIVAVILQQQVLSWHLNVIKLLMLELGQVMAPVLQLLPSGFAVQNVLKLISPALQTGHKLAKCRLVSDEIMHKRRLDLGLEQVLREASKVCLRDSRELFTLVIENQSLEQLL